MPVQFPLQQIVSFIYLINIYQVLIMCWAERWPWKGQCPHFHETCILVTKQHINKVIGSGGQYCKGSKQGDVMKSDGQQALPRTLECSGKGLSENKTFKPSLKNGKGTSQANIQGPKISDRQKSKGKLSDMFENRKESKMARTQ